MRQTSGQRTVIWVLGAALLAGCGSSGDDNSDADVPDGVESGDFERDDGVEDGEAREDVGEAEDGPGRSCGDGIVDLPEEECDDGTANSNTEPDACRTDCRRAWCGDGVTDTGEACDDGNRVDTDECMNNCRRPGCGDGLVDPGEECDDGNADDTDDCLNACLDARCGDLVVWTGHEDCDGTASEACTTTCDTIGTRGCMDCTFAFDCIPPPEVCNGLDENCDTIPDDGFACIQGRTTSCTSPCGSPGEGTCTADCSRPPPEACPPLEETCNGRDDDCDDLTDEIFVCAPGQPVSCTTSCLSAGSGVCRGDCTLPRGADCAPPGETCNGIDDDCDMTADDGFACALGSTVSCLTTCSTPGTGTCLADCTVPLPAACPPPAETCNAEDDDCDGATDEIFSCRLGDPVSCSTTCGSTGTGTCTATCALPPTSACTPPAETCNGLDDNCNSLRDETFACIRGALMSCTASCGTLGTGPCSDTCTPPTTATCTPPLETCNGADDDCDTIPDDGYACQRATTVSCTTTCGSTGSGVCTASCTRPTGASCSPPAETCNGLDDDCDLVRDDGFPCIRGASLPCTTFCGTTGSALCSDTCALPAPGDCTPPVETCNMIDDDCDTVPDDGFPCRMGSSRTCSVSACPGTQSCLSGTCTWGTCNIGSAPLNDSCSSLTIPTLASTNGTYSYAGSTCSGTNSYAWTCGTATGSGPDVVYRLTLTTRKVVTLDTIGSAFDAMLYLRSGTTCSTALALDCDNDSAGGTPPQARIQRLLEVGTYWVWVDSTSSTLTGPFTLNLSISDPIPPANDTCAAATPLTLTPTLQSITGDTTTAISDNTACAYTSTAYDVWYTFTLATPMTVYLSTLDGGTWNSVIHVRSGSCTGPLPDSGCANDACGTTRSMFVGILPAGTYYVAIDGYTSTSFGPFTLYYQGSPCVAAADAVTSTLAIDPIRTVGTYTGTTVAQGNDSTGTCAAGATQIAPDVYYYLGVCPGRTVSASTCDSATVFDTVLYARYGTCMLGPGDPDTVCNNDPTGPATCPLVPPGAASSGLWFGSAGQGLYFLWVDGFVNPSGTLPSEGTYGLLIGGL